MSAKTKRPRSRSSAAAFMFLKEPEPPRRKSIGAIEEETKWSVQKSSGGTKQACNMVFGDESVAFLDSETDDLIEKYTYEHSDRPKFMRGLNIVSFMYQSVADENAYCRVVVHTQSQQDGKNVLKVLQRKLGLEAEADLLDDKDVELMTSASMIVRKKSSTKTSPPQSPKKGNSRTHSPLCRTAVESNSPSAVKKSISIDDDRRNRSRSKPPIQRKTLMDELDSNNA